MTKNDIINYVVETPYNTNKAVLNSMLNQLVEDSDGDETDFEIFNITLTGDASLRGAFVRVEEGYGACTTPSYFNPTREGTENIQLVGYQGKAVLAIEYDSDEKVLQTDGNIEYNESEECYMVTGESSIVISGKGR